MHSQKAARPGPLVAPVAGPQPYDWGRVSRQLVLPEFGDEAQRRVAGARVLIVGAGGLGCTCAPLLAGAGVGTIGLVDDDIVEVSNLHRQVAHRTATVGRPKVDSLAEALEALNPDVRVNRHQLRLTSSNAAELFAGYDLVIDGSDNFDTRYLTDDAARLQGLPVVWGAIQQYSGQLSVAWHRYGAGYRDVFPEPPVAGMDCAGGGVLPSLCGTIGSLLATEALKLITGLGDPLIGRVLVYEALHARMQEVQVQPHDLGERVGAHV